MVLLLHANSLASLLRRVTEQTASSYTSVSLPLQTQLHWIGNRLHLVVSPTPFVTPDTVFPTPWPSPETVLPAVSVTPETPLPTVSVTLPRVLPC